MGDSPINYQEIPVKLLKDALSSATHNISGGNSDFFFEESSIDDPLFSEL